ncbi:MAG TPA: hypothetical protein VIR32_00730 [Lachnospiraceae bacterium]
MKKNIKLESSSMIEIQSGSLSDEYDSSYANRCAFFTIIGLVIIVLGLFNMSNTLLGGIVILIFGIVILAYGRHQGAIGRKVNNEYFQKHDSSEKERE